MGMLVLSSVANREAHPSPRKGLTGRNFSAEQRQP